MVAITTPGGITLRREYCVNTLISGPLAWYRNVYFFLSLQTAYVVTDNKSSGSSSTELNWPQTLESATTTKHVRPCWIVWQKFYLWAGLAATVRLHFIVCRFSGSSSTELNRFPPASKMPEKIRIEVSSRAGSLSDSHAVWFFFHLIILLSSNWVLKTLQAGFFLLQTVCSEMN